MSDGIEAAISSSIASLPGSDASSSSSGGGGSSSTSSAVADAPADSGSGATGDTPHSDTPISDSDAAAASPDGAAAADPAPVVPATDTVAAVADVPAEDSLDTLKNELAGKRDNRIPYSRVTKIVENAEKKVRAEYEAEVAPYRTPEFQNGVRAMQLADEKPDKFLSALVQADPRYAELLAGAKFLAGGEGAPAASSRTAPVEVPEGSLDPDIQLADGTLGYSADTTKAVVQQAVAKVRAEMAEEFRAMLKEEMKGVEPLVTRERQAQMRGEAAERVSKRIAAAEKWPGFTENKEPIAEYINAATKRGERVDLHEAYIAVVMPKFRTDEATVRAKIVAEMNKAAGAATRVAPGPAKPAVVAADSSIDPVEAAIRESIASLK